jgi:hypothetical protein
MNITNFPRVSNRADWIETIELIDDDTGEVITDLTGVTVAIEVRQLPSCCRVLSGTTEDGTIAIQGNGIIQWHFTKSQMSNLCAATYQIGITVERDDITEQELIGSLPIVDGVVRS